jgi:hypothetical protein
MEPAVCLSKYVGEDDPFPLVESFIEGFCEFGRLTRDVRPARCPADAFRSPAQPCGTPTPLLVLSGHAASLTPY